MAADQIIGQRAGDGDNEGAFLFPTFDGTEFGVDLSVWTEKYVIITWIPTTVDTPLLFLFVRKNTDTIDESTASAGSEPDFDRVANAPRRVRGIETHVIVPGSHPFLKFKATGSGVLQVNKGD